MRKNTSILSILLMIMMITSMAGAQAPIPLDPGKTYVAPGGVLISVPSSISASNVTAINITQTTATITAQTNVPAKVVFEYGSTLNYGTTLSPTVLGTNHSKNLSGLQSNKLYNFRLKITDANNVSFTTGNYTFTTLGPVPVSFAVTIATAGNGTGTVGGQGNYVPGVTVALSAIPNQGSTFTGWSPLPCANSFVMPSAALNCVATFAENPVPPVSGSLNWIKLADQNLAERVPNWYNLARDRQNRFYSMNWSGEVWRFDPATPSAKTVKVAQFYPPGNSQHNCSITGDSFLNRIWVTGMCGSTTITDSLIPYYYDVDADTVGVSPASLKGGSNSAGIYDAKNKQLLAFAGWLTSIDLYAHLNVLSLNPVATQWTTQSYTPSPTAEYPANSVCDRFAQNRAGYDTKRDLPWIIMSNGNLWTFDGTKWKENVTTGTKPSACTEFTYHAGFDRIVGWAGQDFNDVNVNTTYLLNITTLTWEIINTVNKPPTTKPTVMAIGYDEIRQQVVLEVTGAYWALQGTLDTTIPPTTQTYSLGFTTTGSGTGTVVGSGSYESNTNVNILASPAANSTFSGWSGPAGCPQSTNANAVIVMPAVNLQCVATFAIIPPGGNTGEPVIPLQMFVARPAPRGTTDIETMWLSPFAIGSKDVSFTQATDLQTNKSYLIVGTGDYSQPPQSSGHNTLYRVDIGKDSNTWTMIAKPCAAPGQISPTRPSDRGILAFDPTHGTKGIVWQLTLGRGFASPGDICNEQASPSDPIGSTQVNGLLQLDVATGVWTKIKDMGINGLNEGVMIPDENIILRIGDSTGTPCSLGGFKLETLDLTTFVTTTQAFSCWQPFPDYLQGNGTGWIGPANAHYGRFAWDAKQKIAYVCGLYLHYTASAGDGQQMYGCHKYNHATKTITPVAPLPQPPAINGNLYISPTYDSRNNVVIWPASKLGQCAVIVAMLVYTPATDTWESIAPVSDTLVANDIRGSIAAYDYSSNTVFIADSGSCDATQGYTGYPPNTIWRYK